ncbi:hypothetical protein N7462_010016 [Penicillium macrosclerotiorum]|uniref:uncharacterized protein n=1 Tax=Penicillium macrosclerotiorum TaxID=303699 RepID=UPI0025496C14|nr:uncharacterized protein N7462_010016 [Penicillium macrosclerotiorum]KAJ5668946.1 hypothetical protein N7462_010016 [Penicillium macrosclerotiorum]
MQLLLGLNLLASFVSATGGVIAASNPATLSGSTQVTSGERYYQRMYTVRTIPFELLSGLAPFYYTGPVVSLLVGVSAIVQAADVAIGFGQGDRGMIVGASVATVIHTLCFMSMW